MAFTISHIDKLQRSTESQVSTVPFASEPEIHGENIFIFDQNLNVLLISETLASEAKHLINILQTTQPEDIQEQFQIELRKINIHDDRCSTYRMSLRIDSVLWFKHHTLNDNHSQKLEHLYRIGSDYIEKVINEIKNEHQIKRTEWRSDKNSPATDSMSDEYKKNYNIHFSRFKNKGRRVYQSRSDSIKLNGRRVSCVLQQDTVVKSSNYPYFMVSTRSDTTAGIIIKSVKQCSNEDYVQTCDAWQAVLQTLIYMKEQLKLDKLPLNYMYINFGDRSVNAHINIVLTRETIEKNQLKDKPPLFPSLVGSIVPLKTHHLNDSWKLIEYMNDHMTPTLIKQNRELKQVLVL